MTIKYTELDGYALKNKQIIVEQNCTQFKSRFSKDDYIFGEHSNTTFYIHVYKFVASPTTALICRYVVIKIRIFEMSLKQTQTLNLKD